MLLERAGYDLKAAVEKARGTLPTQTHVVEGLN